MLIEDILSKFGLNWGDLDTAGHAGEREYLLSMVDAIEQKQVSVQTIREHIANMKGVVEQQLVNEPEFKQIFIFKVLNRKQIYLKARLQNYLLLEAMLSAPEKAQKMIEQQLSGIKTRKG